MLAGLGKVCRQFFITRYWMFKYKFPRSEFAQMDGFIHRNKSFTRRLAGKCRHKGLFIPRLAGLSNCDDWEKLAGRICFERRAAFSGR